jgi:glutamate dehydrogenase (NADP+)
MLCIISWVASELDAKLQQIMTEIHTQCVKYGKQTDGYINYMKGANVAGFLKVARAMLQQGIV